MLTPSVPVSTDGRVLILPPSPRSIPSPHDGEVGRVRERGFQKSATIRWNEPLSSALSPLVPRRERGHFSDGACIKTRPPQARRSIRCCPRCFAGLASSPILEKQDPSVNH